jgi:predicted dehydrogenase
MKRDNIFSLDRRDFLTAGSVTAIGLMFNGRTAMAEDIRAPLYRNPSGREVYDPDDETPATPVNIAVIGLGPQGRDLLTSLSYMEGANVVQLCDHYESIHGRAKELAPKANTQTEYKAVLDDKSVQAVFVATPSHLHKQIVLDALQAGKHVYCEAPLAVTVDDAKAIAQAAKAATKQVFHSGVPYRANKQHSHVLGFIRTGAVGKVCLARAQWNKRTSWRRKAASDERQKELNWRLYQKTSAGLLGEIGLHQIDVFNWFLKSTPVAVTGFGDIAAWQDGRDVHDTVQCIVEYPNNVRLSYSATLANSFEGAYELLQGTESAVLMREVRAWMIKESDAAALGWEVYAYREKLAEDIGIALVADATKILSEGKKPGENRDVDPKRTPLYYSCSHFINAIRSNKMSPVDESVGYEATVCAIKCNEAVVKGTKIQFEKSWFEF